RRIRRHPRRTAVNEADVVEPEPVPPASRGRRNRRAVMAGVALLALVAGGLVVAGGGRGREARPLALMAGNGSASEGRSMGAPTAATGGGGAIGRAVAPGADGKALIGSGPGGWGLEFRVAGALADLGDHATAWNVSGPA